MARELKLGGFLIGIVELKEVKGFMEGDDCKEFKEVDGGGGGGDEEGGVGEGKAFSEEDWNLNLNSFFGFKGKGIVDDDGVDETFGLEGRTC